MGLHPVRYPRANVILIAKIRILIEPVMFPSNHILKGERFARSPFLFFARLWGIVRMPVLW